MLRRAYTTAAWTRRLTTSVASRPKNIVLVDWGTTSLRATLIDSASHRVIDRRTHDRGGIMQVEQDNLEPTLLECIAGWDDVERIVACGMIGSRQGILEVPYIRTPVDVSSLAIGCGHVQLDGGRLPMSVVPGVLCPASGYGHAADVMRGEETQLLGAAPPGGGTQLYVLPGTHSKWAVVREGKLERFHTFMTGELFAVLRDHSILGKLFAAPPAGSGASAAVAFERGLQCGAREGAGGLLHTLFSTRTHALTGELEGHDLPSYLSGMMLASEVRDALAIPHIRAALTEATASSGTTPPVTLLGGDALCERYVTALSRFGVPAAAAGDSALDGLRHVARALDRMAPPPSAPAARADARGGVSAADPAPSARARFDAALSAQPLVAILRGVRPDEAAEIGEALVRAGVTILEVPLNSPEPTKSIRALVDAVGDRALVGAGTVLTPSDVDAVAAAGGTLIVSPDANEDVIRRTTALGLVSLPGVATPAEAFRALQHGADALKLFPAEAAPPPVLKAIRAVLPKGTRVLVVGGVGCSRASMEPYWGVGAAGFGLGGSLYQPGMSAEEVGTRAAAAVSAARELLGETGG